ncbi:MAG: TatD family hydrolase [Fibrobacteria bacterium]|nr:TatD family hydrolase [Fibrobacteria bacterium]
MPPTVPESFPATWSRPVDAHVHGSVDRSRRLALRVVDPGSTIAEDRPRCWGLHPWTLEEATWGERFETLAAQARRGELDALGETGMDRLRGPDLSLQEDAFRAHRDLSEELRLPLVVHNVRCGSELLRLRKSHRSDLPWLLHGWTGSVTQARQFLDAGCLLGLGRDLLHPESPRRALLARIPRDSWLLETDDSSLPIEKLEIVAGSITGQDLQELRRQQHETFARFLGTPRHPSFPG